MSDGEGMSVMTSKEKMILVSLVLGTFMAALDGTIVSVALPTMAEQFSTAGSTADVSWILLGYTLSLCCGILLWGKLGTNIGYKKVYLTGIVLFTLFSGLIGTIGTIGGEGLDTIIILRILQGLGAGMMTAMGLAMVSSYIPNGRGYAVGIITLAASAGTAFGPALGGLLCHFDWSYIFFINVPIGIICLLMCIKYMAHIDEQRAGKRKLDLLGVVLMVVMMFSAIYYLNSGSKIGWVSDEGVVLVVIAAVSAGLLAWWEQKKDDPLIPVRLMRVKDVVRTNIVSLLLFAAMGGAYLLMPYYLQGCIGLTTVEMGLIMIANSIGMMVVGPAVGKVSDKTGLNGRLVSIGCLVAALGFFLLTLLQGDSGLPYIIMALFVMGMGMGIALVSSTNLGMEYAEKGEEGLFSGLITTFRQAGTTVGVAILQAIFAAAIIVPSVVDPADLSWLMTGFRPAFFMAMVLSLAAFAVSMFTKDRKIRAQMDGEQKEEN